ncbi:MAG: hypothetical protein ACHQM6_08460 [Candidatus Kapaibacterium sp.]
MEESNSTQSRETELDQISEQENKEDLRAQHFAKKTELPRHPNKMVAEKTTDMYFSGLMTE